jgi:7,8-dihydroneopterin aldolase/epimerase/oxygenase
VNETLEASDAALGASTGPVIHSYTLRLRGIRFEANIGASAEERSVRQELVVDVDLSLSPDDLPERDVLSEVVDYEAIVRCVVEERASESYHLLETYAKRVVARLLAELPALRVRVAVTKKKVPTTYAVEEAVVELVGTRPPNLNPPPVRRLR